ncbi:MAG TPA: cellulose binding domain-containing protein [Bacillota bacterium]|nr:cellulose binding domain-containing protein [Bacillota bacterium]
MRKWGMKSICLLFLMLFMVVNAAPSLNAAPPPPPPVPEVRVQMYNGNTTPHNNTIFPWFKIINVGRVPVNLEEVKIRYYYTIDGERRQNFWCDWCTIGAGNVTGRFERIHPPRRGADYYFELGFKREAGFLHPRQSIEVHTRLAKVDWSNYNQMNDYSFNPRARTYEDWDKITVHLLFMVVNAAPSLNAAPPPPPPVPEVRVQMYNGNTTPHNNTIFPWFKIINVGRVPVNLEEVKIRYYYTIDGERRQNFWCDWCTIGAGNVTGRFERIHPPRRGADYYFELGFKREAGFLHPRQSIEVHTRLAKVDWSNYNQMNDYSFNPRARTYVDWDKITVHFEKPRPHWPSERHRW